MKGDVINKLNVLNGKEDTYDKARNKVTFYLYLESTASICTDGGAISGRTSQANYTCNTTYNYKWNCTTGGSSTTGGSIDDSPDGSGSSSGGGVGGSSPESLDSELETSPIITQLDTPCEQMDKLEKDTSFINKMKNLKSKTELNYETGYLIKRDGDNISYTSIEGTPNSGTINFSVSDKIHGYMHTH